MKFPCSIAFLLSTLTGWGQQTKVIDVEKQQESTISGQLYSIAGEPVSNVKYVRLVEGTPYFNANWMIGNLELSGGRPYKDLFLKIDMVDNSVLFQDNQGNEMAATTPIKAISLIDSVAGKTYNFIYSSYIKSSNTIEAGWYQVLASGKATIYRRYVKTTNESKSYGSATTDQTIVTASQYYLLTDSNLSRIKKFKDLPGLLSKKTSELDQYITEKKLSGKSDTDFTALVTYYNSLLEK